MRGAGGPRYGSVGGGGGGSGGYQQRDQQNQNRIFVGGISESIQKEDLETVFSKYGRLTNVWVAQNPPGFAFVDFDDNQNASDAVAQMDGQELNGMTLKVAPYRGRRNNRGRGGFRGSRGGFGSRGSYGGGQQGGYGQQQGGYGGGGGGYGGGGYGQPRSYGGHQGGGYGGGYGGQQGGYAPHGGYGGERYCFPSRDDGCFHICNFIVSFRRDERMLCLRLPAGKPPNHAAASAHMSLILMYVLYFSALLGGVTHDLWLLLPVATELSDPVSGWTLIAAAASEALVVADRSTPHND